MIYLVYIYAKFDISLLVILKEWHSKFVEASILFCQWGKFYALLNYLPDSFLLKNIFYETSYDLSVCLSLNLSDDKNLILSK